MSRNSLHNKATAYAPAFGVVDITTSQMRAAIDLWFDLYYHNSATELEDTCQRIPYTIVQKLTKAVFSEYEATSEDKFAADLLRELKNVSTRTLQAALIGGEALIKPVLQDSGMVFSVTPRNNLLVFGRDARGALTDIGTTEVTTAGNCYYTLLERRTLDANGFLTIQYKLFKSYTKENLGQQVSLTTLPQYAQLQESYTFNKPVNSIGLISLRTPMVNSVDGSMDSVSVYAPAVGLIHNINRNEAQINGEFDRGESRIIVSADMLQKDEKGNCSLKDHLFVGMDEDPDTVGVTIFSPQLREQSFLARKQEYLRNVENVIGLKRGLLSEVEAAERTATEITSSAGEYNLTVIDFQRVWEHAVKETMRVCSILGQLYNVAGAHDIPEDAVVINWGNGVLYDEAKTDQELLAQVSAGLLQPERYLGWYYNLPCDTPEERKAIREKYMPEDLEEETE